MRFEFSQNLKCLLRNSLTVETPDFSGHIATQGRVQAAGSSHFNRVFTMTSSGRADVLLPVRWRLALV